MSPQPTPCVVVVGTGTGVGKTRVAALLVEALRATGKSVAVSKPLASGCARRGGRHFSSDAVALARALGLRGAAAAQAHDGIAPWRAVPPLAPGLALRRPPSVAALVAHVEERAAGHDILLVEGAGGLLLPYASDGTVLDVLLALARRPALDLRVVLVGASALGTINHTCLSVSALRQAGLEPAAVALSRTRARCTPDEAGNPKAIARLAAVATPLVVPFVRTARSRSAARAVARALLRRILPGARRAGSTRRGIR